MTFWLIRKLFRKEKTQDKSNAEIVILKESEINKIREEEGMRIFENFLPKFENFYQNLVTLIDDLEIEIEKMEKKEPKISDEKIKSFVESNKVEFIQKMKSFVEEAQKPYEKSLKGIVVYYNNLASKWNKINIEATRNYKIIKDVFKEARKIVSIFKKIYKIIEKESANIKLIADKISKMDEISKNLEDLEWIRKNKEQLKHYLEEKKSLLRNVENEKREIIKQIEDFELSEEMKKLRELTKIKNSIEYKEKELASQSVQLISPLTRELKKFGKIFAEKEYPLIRKYIDSPFDALIEDEELKINQILMKMKRLIEDGTIETKNKEKSLSLIEKILNDNLMKKIKEKHIANLENLKEIEKEIRKLNIDKRKRELESQKNYLERRKDEIEKDIEKTKSKIDELVELEKIVKNEIEKKLSTLVEKKVKVLYI